MRQLRHDLITSRRECEATPTEAPQLALFHIMLHMRHYMETKPGSRSLAKQSLPVKYVVIANGT